MRERPILFSAPMVRALLDGSKTQTRRVVKLPKSIAPEGVTLTRLQSGYAEGARPVFGLDDEPNAFSVVCPYGQPGDRLWVREAWAASSIYDATPPSKICDHLPRPFERPPCGIAYPASGGCIGLKLRPSIHMPRHASRITLEVTAVRVERLHDITADDAMAEGIVRLADGGYAADKDGRHYHAASAWHAYASLWEQINGAGSWTTNPWVWAVEFRRLP